MDAWKNNHTFLFEALSAALSVRELVAALNLELRQAITAHGTVRPYFIRQRVSTFGSFPLGKA